MPIRVHVFLLLDDPIPPETNEQMLHRVLTVEGWMDGILAWEHWLPGQPMLDNINLQSTEDPGDDWTTRPADPEATFTMPGIEDTPYGPITGDPEASRGLTLADEIDAGYHQAE